MCKGSVVLLGSDVESLVTISSLLGCTGDMQQEPYQVRSKNIGFGIRDPEPIPNPGSGVKKALDRGSGSATLVVETDPVGSSAETF
jgi:hypothetical protein